MKQWRKLVGLRHIDSVPAPGAVSYTNSRSDRMNPLRSLMLMLSRTPPAVMLVAIVGLAVLITFTVTSSQEASKAQLDEQMKQMQERANSKSKAVYVVKDIPEGAVIEADNLSEKDIETSRMPADALPSAANAIGRRSKFGVNAGQILSSHDLSPIGISQDFNSKLKEGMRAVTFAVDTNSGVAGFVAPESHVDVLSMVGAGAETRVSAILSDVEVIAVGQMYEREVKGQAANPAGSVTVAVTPEDTQKLVKAVAASKLYLSLRNDKDHTPVTTVDVTALFPQPKKTEAMGMEMPANISMALPGPGLPPLPGPATMDGTTSPSLTSTTVPVPPPLHEIEIWSGAKKDVLSVPSH